MSESKLQEIKGAVDQEYAVDPILNVTLICASQE